MNWKSPVQYVSMTLGLFVAGIGLAGIPTGLQDLHFQLLTMLDETGVRIAYAFLGVLLLIGPDYYFRFGKWRGDKLARKRHGRLLYTDAYHVVHLYVQDAIKDRKDGTKLFIKRSILESFEKNCPDGMKDEGVYDGHALEEWIRHNAIKILLAHRDELGPLGMKIPDDAPFSMLPSVRCTEGLPGPEGES